MCKYIVVNEEGNDSEQTYKYNFSNNKNKIYMYNAHIDHCMYVSHAMCRHISKLPYK